MTSYESRIFKNVRIKWTNFAGEVSEFNPQIKTDANGKPLGKRYFSIILTDEMAEELRNLEMVTPKTGKVVRGCNIRTNVYDDGRPPEYAMKVAFGEKHPPESIYRITDRGKTPLNLETVYILDSDMRERKLDYVDAKVTLAAYDSHGNTGITAYLQKLHAYVTEDDFDTNDEFASIPTIGVSASPIADEDELPF